MRWQVLEVVERHSGFINRAKVIGQVEAPSQPVAVKKAIKELCGGDWSRGPDLSVHPARSPVAKLGRSLSR